MFAFSNKPKGTSKGNSLSTEERTETRKSPAQSDCSSISSASGQHMPQNSDAIFSDINEQTCVREPGQLEGRQFTIRNCTDSLLALLDLTSSITIENCNNCILICGPCRGSVFLRDCTNCLLLAACQQFRACNCHEIEAHLHATTCPTIEDTEIIVAPLLMSYQEMEEHMIAAGLERTLNRWKEVQNFTPDTGKFQMMPFDPFGNGAIACEVVTDEMLERLSTFMESPEARELLLGPS